MTSYNKLKTHVRCLAQLRAKITFINVENVSLFSLKNTAHFKLHFIYNLTKSHNHCRNTIVRMSFSPSVCVANPVCDRNQNPDVPEQRETSHNT